MAQPGLDIVEVVRQHQPAGLSDEVLASIRQASVTGISSGIALATTAQQDNTAPAHQEVVNVRYVQGSITYIMQILVEQTPEGPEEAFDAVLSAYFSMFPGTIGRVRDAALHLNAQPEPNALEIQTYVASPATLGPRIKGNLYDDSYQTDGRTINDAATMLISFIFAIVKQPTTNNQSAFLERRPGAVGRLLGSRTDMMQHYGITFDCLKNVYDGFNRHTPLRRGLLSHIFSMSGASTGIENALRSQMVLLAGYGFGPLDRANRILLDHHAIILRLFPSVMTEINALVHTNNARNTMSTRDQLYGKCIYGSAFALTNKGFELLSFIGGMRDARLRESAKNVVYGQMPDPIKQRVISMLDAIGYPAQA